MTQKYKNAKHISPKDVLLKGDHPKHISEAFEQTCIHLFHQLENRPSKIILSAGITDFADFSFVATANLAITIAKSGYKTLLINGNLKNPDLPLLFDVENKIGLIDVSNKNVPFEEAVHKEVAPSLDFLCGGTYTKNISEGLNSSCAKNLLLSLQNHYDYIVIHTSPVNRFPDSLVLLGTSAGIVLFVERYRTKTKSLLSSIEKIRNLDGEILGVVITGILPNHSIKHFEKYKKQKQELNL